MSLSKKWPSEIAHPAPVENKALFAGTVIRDGYSFPVMDIHFTAAADNAFIEKAREDIISNLGEGNVHICDTTYRGRFLQVFVTNPEKARLHQQKPKGVHGTQALVPIAV